MASPLCAMLVIFFWVFHLIILLRVADIGWLAVIVIEMICMVQVEL